MTELGKVLVIIGLAIALAGLVLWSGFGKGWIGRLPGDFQYSKGNFSFYFPLATSLLISVVLTVVLWLFKR